MPIATTYDEAAHLRTHVLSGTYDGPTLIDEVRAVYETPGFVLRANVLWDISRGDFSGVSREEIRVVASYIQGAWRGTSDLRGALVTGSDLNFGLARMYEQLQGVYQGDNLRVFRDFEPAERWVRGED